MAKVHGPGTYVIKLSNPGKPSLYASDGTTPIDNPLFETFGEASFVFRVVDPSDVKHPLFFCETPITWSELDPPGNKALLEGETILKLDVCHPAAWKEARAYHFKLHINLGEIDEVLWSHDGTVIVDPTIVENPPN